MIALLCAVDALNDRLIAAEAIGDALDLAAGESSPAWVYVYQSQIEAIRGASEALETLVRGIGGVAPDEAKRSGIKGVEL
jgi:hypothetical protein